MSNGKKLSTGLRCVLSKKLPVLLGVGAVQHDWGRGSHKLKARASGCTAG